MSVLRTLSKLFPPPQYIAPASLGVDISDSSLKYIQFTPGRRNGMRLQLKTYGDIDIPSDTVERGAVKNSEALVAAIKEAKEKSGVRFVHVSLPEERAFLFETEIKKSTPFKEVRGQLEFKLEENVPLPAREAFFDYDIVPHTRDESVLRVSVTAYARETIMSYYEACLAAGVLPLSFQVEAQAIARAALPKNDQGTHLIVDFGKTRTGIGIVHYGQLMYTSTIDIGGNELSSALRRQLGDKSEKEFTELKNQHGLIRSNNEAEVYEALMGTVSAVASELGTRIQYWNTRSIDSLSQDVESVILCGGSSNLKGLPGYLREILGVDVTLAEVWQNAFSLESFVPPISRRHSYGYATAIGLALTDFDTIWQI